VKSSAKTFVKWIASAGAYRVVRINDPKTRYPYGGQRPANVQVLPQARKADE
jgi:hypothetical protein